MKVAATPLKRTSVVPVKSDPVIVTWVPTRPYAGENPVIVVAGATVKSVALVALPAEFVTVILPVVAPVGTVAVMRVAELTVKVAAATPLKRTEVVPAKFAPVMVTVEPTGPVSGLNEVIVGVCVTTKSFALVPVPTPLVIVIFPVVAPAGTTAVIWVSELSVKVAFVPLNFTVTVPVKSSPVMTTEVPTGPSAGVKDTIVGAHCVTVKFVALVPVPLGPVTAILPVVAPVGTTAVMRVAELTVNDDAATPLKVTPVAPVKPVPVRVTLLPTHPLAGVKEVIAGGLEVTVKLDELVAVPPAVVTVIAPVPAPAGTVAVICVEELTVNVALVPAKRTAVAPVKFVPVMTTEVPTGPLAGENDVMVGAAGVVTSKLVVLLAVPAEFVTEMGPSVAPVGTVAVTWVAEFTVNVAVVPLNLTAVAPVKFVPVMTTDVPTGPLVGANEVTVGALVAVTSKLVEEKPTPSLGTRTLIAPSVAPVGTEVVIWVSETTVKAESTPLNSTLFAPVKPVPVRVTLVPTGPLVGLKLEIVGAAAKAAGAMSTARI